MQHAARRISKSGGMDCRRPKRCRQQKCSNATDSKINTVNASPRLDTSIVAFDGPKSQGMIAIQWRPARVIAVLLSFPAERTVYSTHLEGVRSC
jgi:hypothetical protein